MGSVNLDFVTYKRRAISTAKMNRQAAALGVLVVVISTVAGLPEKRPQSNGFLAIQPSYGAPPPSSYGPPPQAPTSSYGPPPAAAPQCYPKVVTKTMTKDMQGTSMHYAAVTKEHPTTIWASITETVVGPNTVILTSTMTAYAEPKILTQTKILTDTKMVTVPQYMSETSYGYNTAKQYFTETTAVYETKTDQQSYPITQAVTNTNYDTQAYYVTQTILRRVQHCDRDKRLLCHQVYHSNEL